MRKNEKVRSNTSKPIGQFSDVSIISYLKDSNFFLYRESKKDDPIFIFKEGNLLTRVDVNFIIRELKDEIDEDLCLGLDYKENAKLLKEFYTEARKMITDGFLKAFLNEYNVTEPNCKNVAYFYFTNGFVKVTKSRIVKYSYDKLNWSIWDDDIIEKDIHVKDSLTNCEFRTFIKDITKMGKTIDSIKQMKSLMSILGYLAHSYNSPAKRKAVILMDSYNGGNNPNGGTGKGIILKALKYIYQSKFAEIDGKAFNFKNTFKYDQVRKHTKLFCINDVRKNIDLEDLFHSITDNMEVNRKYENVFTIESPKIVMTTNYAVLGYGGSHERRRIEFELSPTYHLKYTPEDKFEHLLFYDWEKDQWNLFYNFIFKCVQLYLKKDIITPISRGKERNKIIQAIGEEVYNFCETSIELGHKYNKTELYKDFCSINIDSNIKQTGFTQRIKRYAMDYKNWNVDDKMRSGRKQYIIFFTKTNNLSF